MTFQHKILDIKTNEIKSKDFTNKETQTQNELLRLSILEQEEAQSLAESKQQARLAVEAKLTDLGLTADDLKALLG